MRRSTITLLTLRVLKICLQVASDVWYNQTGAFYFNCSLDGEIVFMTRVELSNKDTRKSIDIYY